MIQTLKVKIEAGSQYSRREIGVHVREHLLQSMAYRTHKWKQTPCGWVVNIPRHPANTLTGVAPYDQAMVIGKARINAYGTITSTLELGWGLIELMMPEKVEYVIGDTKAGLERVIRNATRARQAMLERDQPNADLEKVQQRLDLALSGRGNDYHCGGYVLKPFVDHKMAQQMIDCRKTGLLDSILTPHEVEAVVQRYVWLLGQNFPFLDPNSVRVVSADLYYQWAVPSATSLVPYIHSDIIRGLRKGQNVRSDHNMIWVRKSGPLYNCALYHTKLSAFQPLKDVIRLRVHINSRSIVPLGLFNLSPAASRDGVRINWHAIIGILRARAAEIPVCRYRNDMDLLLDRGVDAKRVVTLADHPDGLQKYLAHVKRPDDARRRLDRFEAKWFDAPLFTVPDIADLVTPMPGEADHVAPDAQIPAYDTGNTNPNKDNAIA